MNRLCVLGVFILSLLVCQGAEAAGSWSGIYTATYDILKYNLNERANPVHIKGSTTLRIIPLRGSRVKVFLGKLGPHAPATAFTGRIGPKKIFAVWTKHPDQCRTFKATLLDGKRLNADVAYPFVHPGGTPHWIGAKILAKRLKPFKLKFKK